MKKYVAYYRVSTQKQGASGLGLEAQKIAVQNFVNCTDCIVSEYTEIESGKNDNREALAAAIGEAKRIGATLVIAKLDRLSRNAAFIFTLRDSGVNFVCADMPDANSLTIGIFAVMAQHEREMISKRTKEGLQAAKQRGTKLGKPQNLTPAAVKAGEVIRVKNAANNAANRQAAALIIPMLEAGATLREAANKLNRVGFKTRNGKQFTAMQVSRLAAKFAKVEF